jgi:ribosome-associated translation inhibitor RaiA
MLHITFRHLESSPAVRALAEELLARVQKDHGEAARCHLVLEDQAGGHAHHPERFAAHLDFSVARHDMACSAQSAHADAHVAIREVFARVERQLSRREDRLSDSHGARSPDSSR